jgi:hypothetical protein
MTTWSLVIVRSLSAEGRRSNLGEGKAKTVVRGFSLVQPGDSTALKGRTTCVFAMGLPRAFQVPAMMTEL